MTIGSPCQLYESERRKVQWEEKPHPPTTRKPLDLEALYDLAFAKPSLALERRIPGRDQPGR